MVTLRSIVVMHSFLPVSKAISVVFAILATYTGLRGIVDPVGFSNFFGLPLGTNPVRSHLSSDGSDPQREVVYGANQHSLAKSYVSLMSVRQLGTGIILLVFSFQGKWVEVATILAVIGLLVAGTDGIYIARNGTWTAGAFHAIPGGLIAVKAWIVIRNGAAVE
jgi:hypothetical protein